MLSEMISENCRGGPPWPPQCWIPRRGGHGVPPLQLRWTVPTNYHYSVSILTLRGTSLASVRFSSTAAQYTTFTRARLQLNLATLRHFPGDRSKTSSVCRCESCKDRSEVFTDRANIALSSSSGFYSNAGSSSSFGRCARRRKEITESDRLR